MLGMLSLFPNLVIEDRKERLIRWANRSESYKKQYGEGLYPPEGIFDYPGLLARGWGWERLVTSESSPEDMPTYKKYLKEYYICNTAESVAQEWLNERDANSASYGTGVETRFLATLAKLCIEAEEKFIQKRTTYKTGPADEIKLSEKIIQGVHRIMSLEAESPVAPAALMFITKEAELMCEWLEIKTYNQDHDWCISIDMARRCALDFLEYNGPESSCVAGLMIGIAKETKTICEAMRKNPRESIKDSSELILLDGWDVLKALHGEIFSACRDGAIAGINTVGEPTSKENDGKDSCKTKASADVNSANPSTSLVVAALNGLTDCIKKLEDHEMVKNQAGGDVNSANINTLLKVATVNGVTDRISRKKMMKKVEAGEDHKTARNKASADVNSANPNTSLEVAIVNDLTDCIKKLEDPKIVKNQSQAGADMKSANPNTLLEVATVNGMTDHISRKKMKEAGADQKTAKNQVENCGKIALELKLDGDKAVGRKDYLAASMLYTQAIEVELMMQHCIQTGAFAI